jgi:hypothetical protein
VKQTLALALPVLVAIAACSGNPNFITDDGGTGDDGGTTGDGATTDDGTTPPPPTNAPLATGLTVTGLTVDQAVEVNVVKNGAAVTKNAPIVAGRRGVVRVFVTPGSGWSPHAITGVLTLHTAGQDHVFTASLTPKAASTDATFSSTFNFNVDPPSLGTDTTYLVQLKDPNGPSPGDSSAQYPNSGTPASLGVSTSGKVKIDLIPIHFTSGGGTAATSGVDIFAYQSVVFSMYPATEVDITVMATMNYSGAIPDAYDSNYGWDYLLQAIQNKRAADPTKDVYYYGAFAPTSSFASFCGSGCIAGLSTIPSSPSNYSMKASIGLVYGGSSAEQLATGDTMAHEVGHGHGRSHSPTSYNVQGCSTPNGLDPGYPYANGSIGVWGYDITGSKPIDPSQYYDIMGYCAYDWISDYTYKALFSWVATDNGADMIVSSTPVTYRRIFVHGDGTLAVGDAFPVYGPVSGEPHVVTWVENGITRTATGYFSPYDHIPGGVILVKEPGTFTGMRVPDFSTQTVRLAH